MLRGNCLSLSTTKSLTFALLLKVLYASCTLGAYRFLASTPIYFICLVITKFFGKKVDFKLAICPSLELRFGQLFFEFRYFFARNPDLQFFLNFAQNFQIYPVNSQPKTQNFEISSSTFLRSDTM